MCQAPIMSPYTTYFLKGYVKAGPKMSFTIIKIKLAINCLNKDQKQAFENKLMNNLNIINTISMGIIIIFSI